VFTYVNVTNVSCQGDEAYNLFTVLYKRSGDVFGESVLLNDMQFCLEDIHQARQELVQAGIELVGPLQEDKSGG
jgi:hypothetical protein